MKFADLPQGRVIEAGPVTLDEAAILEFARRYDPQWFHTDLEACRQGPFGSVIASGWQTCAIAMRLVTDDILDGSEAVGSPGINHIRWRNPVRPGDTLRLRAEVVESRRSAKNPDRGVLRLRWQLFNQHGREVLDLETAVLCDLHRATTMSLRAYICDGRRTPVGRSAARWRPSAPTTWPRSH